MRTGGGGGAGGASGAAAQTGLEAVQTGLAGAERGLEAVKEPRKPAEILPISVTLQYVVIRQLDSSSVSA